MKAIDTINNFFYIYKDSVGFNCRKEQLKDILSETYLNVSINYADGSVTFDEEAINHICDNAEEYIANCYVSNSTLNAVRNVTPITNEANKYDNIFHRVRDSHTLFSADTLLSLINANTTLIDLHHNNDLKDKDKVIRGAIGRLAWALIGYADEEMILVEDELEKILRDD